MPKLVLASGSSRRRELLDQIGVSYQVAPMDIDESVHENESAKDYVFRLAKEKALAGLEVYPDKIVLAADTSVEVRQRILGKPKGKEGARQMLEDLSGSKHQVLTGVAIARLNEGQVEIDAEVVITDVCFSRLSGQQIEAYIATGEPMDKAGAYGIQGKAALFVDRIEGSFSNVVGLPLAETGKLLETFGVKLFASLDLNTAV